MLHSCIIITVKCINNGSPGLHKLNCSDYNKFYIGQTGCCFKQRYIEHTKALHSTIKSTFANHLIEANHTYKNIKAIWMFYTYTLKGEN